MDETVEYHPFINDLVTKVEAFRGQRTLASSNRTISLSHLDASLPRMKSWKPQDLMHQIYRQVGFDDNRLLIWRFEHKLVQAEILRRYIPDAVPETRGLFAEVRGLTGTEIRRKLRDLAEDGFIVKTALGEQSGESGTIDKSNYLVENLESIAWPSSPIVPTDENFIIQRRLSINKEYRVHSLEDKVIPDLTFYRYQRDVPPPQESEAVNSYVERLLNSMPNGLLSGSLFGWDIALKQCGDFSIVEANPTGCHLVCNPGFQCSGYFHAAESIARLLRFMHIRYGLQFNITPQEIPSPGNDLHWWVKKSFDLLQYLSNLHRHFDVDTVDRSMKWIDIRMSPAHNSFAWAVEELQLLINSMS